MGPAKCGARRSWPTPVIVLLLLAPYLPRHPLASSGDRAPAFQECLQRCGIEVCAYLSHVSSASQQPRTPCPPGERSDKACRTTSPSGVGSEHAALPKPSLPMHIFHWNCEDECKYDCMRRVEKLKADTGIAIIEKYYGKWPFLRVLGMQELVSVLASLANLLAHALCLSLLRAEALHASRPRSAVPAMQLPPTGLPTATPMLQPLYSATSPVPYPFLWLWTAYACLHMNAWFWSAVFHSRDTRLTERLDYTSAISLVAFGLFAVLVRVLWGPTRRRRLLTAAAGAAVAAGLAAHLHYMLRVKFDYGWNMRVCVGVGVATAGLWLGWCMASRHPARRRMYAFLLLVHLSLLLELLDFPPWAGLLDAHAAWHIATVVLTPLFYSWLRADVAVYAAIGPKRKDT